MNDFITSSLLIDFYELTMANNYLNENIGNKIVYFDMFFRKVPDNAGFSIFAGLGTLINFLENIKFTDEDIEYLRTLKIFNEKFLQYLKNFKFSCDIFSVPEGTVIFPFEPILIVRGPIIQAQLIETLILIIINHQSLITTKASRLVRAARGREVIEFGARRALGPDSSIYGSRASYIGGCSATSNTLAAKTFNIPLSGTMAHSFIQLFDSELDAFRSYAKTYPQQCMLLVDTYNTLHSGIPNAIKIFNEEIVSRGFRPLGIRIDSGDITFLTKKARFILDNAGFKDCKICVSNSLDEYIIRDMLIQGAKIDYFGVGEKLITSASSPIFGGVYKLCAIDNKDNIIPKIKISENISKITIPGFKALWRLFDHDSNKALADIITLHNENISEYSPYEIFDPEHTWKRKTIAKFKAKRLLVPIFIKGNKCYNVPSVRDIREYCKNQVSTLWDEVIRFENPHKYYVDLSKNLWSLRNELISKNKF